MTQAQGNVELAEYLAAQQVVAPRVRGIAQVARRTCERQPELPQLVLGQACVAPRVRLFPEGFQTELLKCAHPPFDTARVIAKCARNFIAALPCGHERNAVQAMRKSRLR
jgi:hypothetical protein